MNDNDSNIESNQLLSEGLSEKQTQHLSKALDELGTITVPQTLKHSLNEIPVGHKALRRPIALASALVLAVFVYSLAFMTEPMETKSASPMTETALQDESEEFLLAYGEFEFIDPFDQDLLFLEEVL